MNSKPIILLESDLKFSVRNKYVTPNPVTWTDFRNMSLTTDEFKKAGLVVFIDGDTIMVLKDRGIMYSKSKEGHLHDFYLNGENQFLLKSQRKMIFIILEYGRHKSLFINSSGLGKLIQTIIRDWYPPDYKLFLNNILSYYKINNIQKKIR